MPKTNPKASDSNVCIRCGKLRVFKESWQEKSESGQGQSTVTYSMFVCPDDECQRQVEIILAEKQKLSQERQEAQDERILKRTGARALAAKKN